ncbi:DUF4267 domain-containing protein [Novosphingobium resinovorum]|uniref:DUF4267 domain-containing protein n=1 Tax=Novosphingobium TaxID=165696 RepID=UPI001B3C6288|nr:MULTISPECIES: DUF4267 domain-containing protein [Novosphingobium]MBF7013864.1 DUF4267 domain-containing protein [Novosphingobium sp. HR1a]WJM26012.1 DUF4267 domain-containing protein [Novosphingobium resinovorum]
MTWIVLGLGCFFCGLGLLFLIFPHTGADIFGIPAVGASALSYVRAVALRDIALGFYIVFQTLCSTRRAVRILLLSTVVIPAGDMLLVLASEGANLTCLPLHLASAGCFLGLGLWIRRTGDRK